MVSPATLVYYPFHPQQLRSIIQWKLWHDPVHMRDRTKESESVSKCYYYLDMTSRSFSSVIQELHPDLKLPVALFYLALRGLDTVEDDMTLSLKKKEPILRDFHTFLQKDGWTFDESGPDESDRDLLVHFDVVVKEFKAIKPAYKTIIEDITRKMGNGMADFCVKHEQKVEVVATVDDYNLYCHYVAGVVGEGLTRLFVEAKLGNPLLLERPYLHESMGRFLQKVNIIRDIREDYDDGRRFWPKEIWSRHVNNFEDLFRPENRQKALNCSSDMVLNALEHADECLFYLMGLKEQSVFNFCAIPQSMAIATLELCFQNYSMFEQNIKITKGQACELMIKSSQNQRVLFEVFRSYAHKIIRKNNPRDPNFLKISMACAKLEKFIQSTFPEQDPKPAEAAAIERIKKTEVTKVDVINSEKAAQSEANWDLVYLGLSVFGTLLLISAMMFGIAWLAGARFDLAMNQLMQGNLVRPNAGDTVRPASDYGHGEL